MDTSHFLKSFWQQKPLVIRNALPGFQNCLNGDDLAGLAMEEEIESRLVLQTPDNPPYWQLQHGPFKETVFAELPKSHWTLLVQGVDRFVPEVNALLDHFNFLPQWRVDDVMVSYAVKHGGVGPHYDNYDVFLYQAKGRRQWQLTSQECVADNYQPGLELRIMRHFNTEETIILEEGDMLYLPPHIGHHGIALSDECITYSFGYRSYQALELWNSLGDWLAEKGEPAALYEDPVWDEVSGSAQLPASSWKQAKKILQGFLEDEDRLKAWFGSFVTAPDSGMEEVFEDTEETSDYDFEAFQSLLQHNTLERNPFSRLAYIENKNTRLQLFVNGSEWNTENVMPELIKIVAENRRLSHDLLKIYLNNPENRLFLLQLWQAQILEFGYEECP